MPEPWGDIVPARRGLLGWLSRRRLRREAQALEERARRLRQTLAADMASLGIGGKIGALVAVTAMAVLEVQGATPMQRSAGGLVRRALTERRESEAAALEARARALRAAAAGLGPWELVAGPDCGGRG